MNTALIGRLASGPLDIVGDVHGERAALMALLAQLGYDADAAHPEGRRLVFVGDLCDRGEDSPGVLSCVQSWCASGRAQAVLGNHELNLLRSDHKEGNNWFFQDAAHEDRRRGMFWSSAALNPDDRAGALRFLGSLPLALQREDLRVVHACWHAPSVLALSAESDVLASYGRHDADIDMQLAEQGITTAAAEQEQRYGTALRERDARLPMLQAVARRDVQRQMGNPVRVLTSGVERPAERAFFSSGKWRMVERARWWDEYDEPVPVIVGHYWRWAGAVDRARVGKGGADLFEGLPIQAWHGQRHNVFCVDYSVGRRFLEREGGLALGKASRLGAVRWPEREIVFEDGERQVMS